MSSTRTLRAYYLVSFASIGIFLPFVSPWLTSLGIQGFALGWIAATRPLAGIAAPVLFGWLADRFGLRGRILRLATFGAFLPFAWLAVVIGLGHSPSASELWLAIGVSSFFRVPMTNLADVSALEKSADYGSSRAFGSVGFILATLMAGALLNPSQPSQFPAAVALAFLAAWALSFRFPVRVSAPTPPTRADIVALVQRPSFLLLLVVTALWATSHVAYDLCISLHLHDLGATTFVTSIGWVIGAIAEVVLMAYWERIKGLLSFERWLLVGLAATALRWLVLAAFKSLPIVLLLQPLHALSFALVWLTLMDLTRYRAPNGLLATAQGTVSMSCSLGASVGMLLFGSLYGHYRGPATFTVAALVSLLACVIFGAVPLLMRGRATHSYGESAQ